MMDLEVRNRLIEDNLALVGFVVYKKLAPNNYEKEELISVGIIGLIKAADNYDVSKNSKFSTFAIKCIYNEILMYMNKYNKLINSISLDDVIYVDNIRINYADIIEDESINLEKDFMDKEIISILLKLLDKLPEKQKKVLKMYCGFDSKPLSQYEISKLIGVSQPEVSRIISRARKKIKKNM